MGKITLSFNNKQLFKIVFVSLRCFKPTKTEPLNQNQFNNQYSNNLKHNNPFILNSHQNQILLPPFPNNNQRTLLPSINKNNNQIILPKLNNSLNTMDTHQVPTSSNEIFQNRLNIVEEKLNNKSDFETRKPPTNKDRIIKSEEKIQVISEDKDNKKQTHAEMVLPSELIIESTLLEPLQNNQQNAFASNANIRINKPNLQLNSLTKVEDSLNLPQVSKLLVTSNEVHANTINLDENKLRTKQEENNLKSSSIINEDKIVESETIPNATGEDKEIKKRKKKKKKKEKITFTPTFN